MYVGAKQRQSSINFKTAFRVSVRCGISLVWDCSTNKGWNLECDVTLSKTLTAEGIEDAMGQSDEEAQVRSFPTNPSDREEVSPDEVEMPCLRHDLIVFSMIMDGKNCFRSSA
jgi:hypothetical protein